MNNINFIDKDPMAKEIIPKGWGYEEILQKKPYVIKTLNYNDGSKSSGHLHLQKSETFFILSGIFELTRKNEKGQNYQTVLHPNDMVYLKNGTYHQISCLESGSILEMSTEEIENDTIVIDAGDSQKEKS